MGGANRRGIHSFEASTGGGCDGRGYSGRVTAGLDFFTAELGKPLPAETCSLCERIATSGKGECRAMNDACLADPQCKGYFDCVQGGKSSAKCFEQYPLDEGSLFAAAGCACARACASVCATSPSCASVPECGYSRPKGACATCVNGACCEEQSACAAAGRCYACLKTGDADPACGKDALRSKLAACIADGCASECADDGSGGAAGTDAPPDDDLGEEEHAAGEAPVTTVTTTGCSQAPGGRSSSAIALVVLAFAALRRRRAPGARTEPRPVG